MGRANQELDLILIKKGNLKVRIGAIDDKIGGVKIREFFPYPTNGPDFVNFGKDEMRAFRDIFKP